MKSSQTLKERKEMMTALALIAPTIIVMVIFLYIPFVNALQTSFYKYNGLGALEHFVGLKNYAKVLADPKFVRSLWNTFYLIMVSFLAIPIGFVFAYILYVGVPGKKIFNAGLFIPYLISMVVVGCIWRIIYDPTIGPVDQFLKMAGLGKYAKAWLSRPETALWAIAVTWIWRSQPFNMLIMYANITKMPEDFPVSYTHLDVYKRQGQRGFDCDGFRESRGFGDRRHQRGNHHVQCCLLYTSRCV